MNRFPQSPMTMVVAVVAMIAFFFTPSCLPRGQSMASINLYKHLRTPATICASINAVRYQLIVDRGLDIEAAFENDDISYDEAYTLLRAVHNADREVRDIVSSSYIGEDGQESAGSCKQRIISIVELARTAPMSRDIDVAVNSLVNDLIALEAPLATLGSDGLFGEIHDVMIDDTPVEDMFPAFLGWARSLRSGQ